MKQIDFTKGNGLVPVVIQDNNTLAGADGWIYE